MVYTRHRDRLVARVRELTERAERQEQQQQRAALGIGRFLGAGRFSLDDLIQTARTTPEALQELRAEKVARRVETRDKEVQRVEQKVAERRRA